ncbi:CDP-alcohol phosphatidyltransferase family protein [Candidatus Babeliales bacterium]|nr:CDP-alcohol phosphatidyltransferase family protein [Candidatus Babeliales bacterium]
MTEKNSFYNQILEDKKFFTLSNGLTFLRILLTPVIVIGIFYEKWTLVFLLILFAGVTDVLDGYVARAFNQITNLGKILDPIADKILLICCFAALAFLQSPSFPIPKWFVLFIVCRESIIIFGSYVIVKTGRKFKVEPTWSGKLTTLFQLIFILWLFICYFFGWVPARTYHTLLVLLPLFSILSLLQYIKIGTGYFNKKNY